MPIQRVEGAVQPGIKWGPFTARVPGIHVGMAWPEFLQGFMVSSATALALVPLMTAYFGLEFEEAVMVAAIHSILISSAVLLFGEPFAAGWITPALPLVLNVVLAGAYPEPTDKFHVMMAMTLNFSLMLFVLGFTGLGKILVEKIPAALKGAIIMGAAIAALKRVFIDDAPNNLDKMPVAMWTAMGVCLVLSFAIPVAKWKMNNPIIAKIASLGLLPGFVLAAVAGIIVGELEYVVDGKSIIEWGILVPPVASTFEKVSPFAIGFPPLSMLLDPAIIGVAFVAYIILFGDIITGMEVLNTAIPKRPDERIEFSSFRTHISCGIRNVLMALFAPLFPTQGALWTGVHVIIVNRWAEGRKEMDSLITGFASYYWYGLPILFILLPVITALKPLMPIALALTLVLTGFACAYVAMDIPRNHAERGVVLFGGCALAFFQPHTGLAIAAITTFLLLGWKDAPPELDPEPDPFTESEHYAPEEPAEETVGSTK